MIESPLLQKMIAESIQKDTLAILKKRFTTVPREMTRLLRAMIDEEKLRKLVVLGATCPNLEAFREALLS